LVSENSFRERERPEYVMAHSLAPPDWLPAVEQFGEGFFLQFSSDALAHWLSAPPVLARAKQIQAGVTAWINAKRARGRLSKRSTADRKADVLKLIGRQRSRLEPGEAIQASDLAQPVNGDEGLDPAGSGILVGILVRSDERFSMKM
jgi:hypothetical protein